MASLRDQFSEFFELPVETVTDLPIIMLAGHEKLYIENHKGITLYQVDMIKVRVRYGSLLVTGLELEIDQIDTDILKISGIITGLSFEGGKNAR